MKEKLRLKKDIIIPAGTIFADDGVINIDYGDSFVMHSIGFGKNATGDLRIGAEIGDKEFDEWFEKVKGASK